MRPSTIGCCAGWCSTAGRGSGATASRWGSWWWRSGSERNPTERNAERFDRWAFVDLDRARRQDQDWFDAFAAYTLSRAVVPHVKRTMGQLIKAGKKRVPDPDLRRIEIRTALLWGRHDRFVSLDLAEAASARLGWPLHVIDDAGHVPHIERPDAFLRALQTVLGDSRPAETRSM